MADHFGTISNCTKIEYPFNLTLTIDVENIALDKLTAHRKGTDVHAETTYLLELTNKLRSADDDKLYEIVGKDVVLDDAASREEERRSANGHGQADSQTLAYQEKRSCTSQTARPR